MTDTAPGTPIWVDLGTTDLESAKRFYGELFGWTAHVSPEPEAGGYTIFNKDGKPVAGAGPVFSPEQPTAWASYLAVDDAEAAAARVVSAGGKVAMAPFDVMDQGRMAVFTDQSGAAFSVWQPMAMTGAQLFDAPGSLTWTELTTRDPAGAKEFYGAVFGWSAEDTQMGPVAYSTFKLGDRPVAGMMPMVGDEWPADLPPRWMVYFAVEDCEAAAALADRLGGVVSVPPTEIPWGRFAVLNDPQGAVFSVIRTTG